MGVSRKSAIIARWGDNAARNGTKECRICHHRKSVEDFSKDPSNKTDGHRATCKACNLKRMYLTRKAWIERNREKANTYSREWQRRNFADRRELMRERSAQNYKKNPHSYIEANAKKRVVCRKATPKWSIRFFVNEAYALAKLRTRLTGIEWQVDHIVPLLSKKVCGLHSHTNIAVIPKADNYAKGNRSWPDMPC